MLHDPDRLWPTKLTGDELKRLRQGSSRRNRILITSEPVEPPLSITIGTDHLATAFCAERFVC